MCKVYFFCKKGGGAIYPTPTPSTLSARSEIVTTQLVVYPLFAITFGARHGVMPWLQSCELKLFWNNFKIISVFYFTHNHVWQWNKIISVTEGVPRLFQNYFSHIEHVV